MSDLVSRVMDTLLNPDAKARVEALKKAHEADVAKFSALPDAALAEEAAKCLRNCSPCRFSRGEPVYDAIMEYVIIPEMISRLRD